MGPVSSRGAALFTYMASPGLIRLMHRLAPPLGDGGATHSDSDVTTLTTCLVWHHVCARNTHESVNRVE